MYRSPCWMNEIESTCWRCIYLELCKAQPYFPSCNKFAIPTFVAFGSISKLAMLQNWNTVQEQKVILRIRKCCFAFSTFLFIRKHCIYIFQHINNCTSKDSLNPVNFWKSRLTLRIKIFKMSFSISVAVVNLNSWRNWKKTLSRFSNSFISRVLFLEQFQS